MHGLEITFALSVMNQRKHEAGAYGLQLEDITQRNPKKKRPSRLPKARMPSTIQKLTGAIMVSEAPVNVIFSFLCFLATKDFASLC